MWFSRLFCALCFFGFLNRSRLVAFDSKTPGLRRDVEVATEQGGHAYPLQRGPASAAGGGASELQEVRARAREAGTGSIYFAAVSLAAS